MKTVLFIITQAEIGGAQKHVIDLSSELQKTGEFECDVASDPNENFAKILKENGVEFSPIKRLRRSINPLSDLFAFFEIYNLIKSRKPNIVHLHSSKVGGIPEMIVGGENGLLITSGDAKELADAILKLSQDEEMAKKLGNEAERTVKEKFGLQEMVKKTMEVY